MFLAPLIRWLVNHDSAPVALGVGLALIGAAIAVAGAGIVTHQPFMARIGLILMIAGVAAFVVRNRRERTEPGEHGRIGR